MHAHRDDDDNDDNDNGNDVSPLRLRWIVNVTSWNPSSEEFDFLLDALVPDHERSAVMKYLRAEDRKRALVSRLLQRNAIARAKCGSNRTAVVLRGFDVRRTKGSKPFYGETLALANAPNFNFNVSHEGDYVVLASETHAVVGVDVAAPGQVRRVSGGGGVERGVESLLETFQSVLTRRECELIRETTAIYGDKAGEDMFRKHWSLKEAHVKAIGVGLGMDLRRCEFAIDASSSTASVSVDGCPRADWMFHIHAFPPVVDQKKVNDGNTHWITVSRGPFGDIVDANGEFTDVVFSKRDFSDEEWSRVLQAPAPPWELLTVGDLVPIDSRDAYEAAGGLLY